MRLLASFSVSRNLLSSQDHETHKYLISVSQDYDGVLIMKRESSKILGGVIICSSDDDNFVTCPVHCICNTGGNYAYFQILSQLLVIMFGLIIMIFQY